MSNLTQIELNGAQYDIRDEISGYINSSANNLANYYKKTETYNKEEIDAMVSGGGGSGTDPEAVKYTPQYLTSGQQSQARTNISAGTYSKPSGGIPDSDLANDVRSSLGKADTAYQKPSTGIPASDIASGVIPNVSGFYTKPASGIPASDLASNVLSGLATQASVDAVNDKIPSVASSNNQLADKAFVRDYVSSSSGDLITNNGQPWTSLVALQSYAGTVNANDYAYVVTVSGQDTVTSRYKYNGAAWEKEYDINSTTLSQAQLDATNSGITATKVGNYDSHLADTTVHVTAADKTAWFAKLDSSSLKTINGKSLVGPGSIYFYELFIAESGNTTYQEVTEALNEAKYVVLKYQDNFAQLLYNTGNAYVGCATKVDSDSVTGLVIYLHSDNSWSAEQLQFTADQVFAAGTGTNAALQLAGSGQENAASGDRSLAIGERNTASGRASVAEGTDTQATATDAHAMGNKCLASGGASLATGVQNVASELGSFAQGICTIATAQGASVMNGGFRLQIALSGAANGTSYTGTRYGTNGEDAINDLDLINQFGSASDYASFLVGCILRQSASSPLVRITACTVTVNRNPSNELTGISYQITTDKTLSDSTLTDVSYNICLDKASGPCSNVSNAGAATAQYAHAEGHQTLAFGIASHAEGRRTVTRNEGEHAEGEYNISYKASDSYNDPGNSIHTVGVGTEEGVRKNAVTVMRNGDIYVKEVGSYDGINLSGAASLQDVIAGKQDTLSSGINIKTINNSSLIGSGNLTINEDPGLFRAGSGTDAAVQATDNTNLNYASGDRSVALGEKTVASGRAALAIGTETEAPGTAAQSSGVRTRASGGASLTTGVQTITTSNGSFAQGICTVAANQGASCMNGGFRLQIALSGAAGATTYTGTRTGQNAIDDLDLINQFGSIVNYQDFLAGCIVRVSNSSPLVVITSCSITVNYNQSTSALEGVTYQLTLDKTLSDSALSNVSYLICLDKAAGQYSNVINAGAALNSYGHASGYQTLSIGQASSAEGVRTVAKNTGEHAEGNYNVSYKASDSYGNAGNSTHTIGIGDDSLYGRKNAVSVMENGDIYIKGVGSYDGVNLAGSNTLQSELTAIRAELLSSLFFEATYGVTTGDELQAAYNAGKMVICHYTSNIDNRKRTYLGLSDWHGDDAYKLISFDDYNSFAQLSVLEGSSPSWLDLGTINYELVSNKTQSLVNNQDKYPSSACVYSEISALSARITALENAINNS